MLQGLHAQNIVHSILTPCKNDCAPGRWWGCHRVNNKMISASIARVSSCNHIWWARDTLLILCFNEHYPFWFPSSFVFVQHQTVEGFRVGQSHLGAHWLAHKRPPWYTAHLVYYSMCTYCRRQDLVFMRECSLPWCFLAWLFCHIRKQTISVWQHHSLHQLCQCWLLFVEWLCYLQIQSPNSPCSFCCVFLQMPTLYRILRMNETSEAPWIVLIIMLVWSHELPDIKLSFLYQRLS